MKVVALFAATLFVGLSVMVSAPAMAQSENPDPGATGPTGAFPIQNARETTDGLVTVIPGSNPAIGIASDGEVAFRPFGVSFDTSDAIQLNPGWAPDPAFKNSFGPNGWMQLPGTSTWVLAACNTTGCENAPIFEAVGRWDFISGGMWQPGAASLFMFEPNGVLSDKIIIANNGPGGEATITFISDSVPEPATWAMLFLGVAMIGFAIRRRNAGAPLAA